MHNIYYIGLFRMTCIVYVFLVYVYYCIVLPFCCNKGIMNTVLYCRATHVSARGPTWHLHSFVSKVSQCRRAIASSHKMTDLNSSIFSADFICVPFPMCAACLILLTTGWCSSQTISFPVRNIFATHWAWHTWAFLRWCFTMKRRYMKCMHLYLCLY